MRPVLFFGGCAGGVGIGNIVALENIMSLFPEHLGMTRLSFMVSPGLGGAVIVSGGATIIPGTFFAGNGLLTLKGDGQPFGGGYTGATHFFI